MITSLTSLISLCIINLQHLTHYLISTTIYVIGQQKEEALYFRVAKTSEVSQIEKELGAEIKELEKQRDKLETELIKVPYYLTCMHII